MRGMYMQLDDMWKFHATTLNKMKLTPILNSKMT